MQSQPHAAAGGARRGCSGHTHRGRARERPEDVPAIEAALQRRDELDTVQSAPAPDALVIDTGPLDLQGVIDTILTRLR